VLVHFTPSWIVMPRLAIGECLDFGILYSFEDGVYILLRLLMNENHNFWWYFILLDNMICIMFVGIIPDKPLRDFTCPLGSPRGLKGIFDMLNAIVFPVIEEIEYLLF
jgi:hypothetical protein